MSLESRCRLPGPSRNFLSFSETSFTLRKATDILLSLSHCHLFVPQSRLFVCVLATATFEKKSVEHFLFTLVVVVLVVRNLSYFSVWFYLALCCRSWTVRAEQAAVCCKWNGPSVCLYNQTKASEMWVTRWGGGLSLLRKKNEACWRKGFPHRYGNDGYHNNNVYCFNFFSLFINKLINILSLKIIWIKQFAVYVWMWFQRLWFQIHKFTFADTARENKERNVRHFPSRSADFLMQVMSYGRSIWNTYYYREVNIVLVTASCFGSRSWYFWKEA